MRAISESALNLCSPLAATNDVKDEWRIHTANTDTHIHVYTHVFMHTHTHAHAHIHLQGRISGWVLWLL